MAHQIFAQLGLDRSERFYWQTATGAELDILAVRGRERIGFEIKRTTAPALTPSMRVALTDSRLNKLWVVHAGDKKFELAPRVTAIPASQLNEI